MSDLREIAREVAEGIPDCRVLPSGSLWFSRGGFDASVVFPPALTDIMFDVGEHVPGAIQVAPAGLVHQLKALFGKRDIEVGDRAFDGAFEISASEEGFARRVLEPAVRAILSSLRMPFLWRISRGGFLLRVRSWPDTARELDRWLVMAFQLLDALPGIDAAGEVRLAHVQERLDEEASCQVCGTGLAQGAVVRCAKCRTPHHRDCWEFNGRCSTFACGETRIG